MSKGASETLVEFCQQEAGPYLRAVFHYENGEFERLYVRDDVAEQYSESEWDDYFSRLAAEEEDETGQTTALNVGNHHATLRLYDDALVLHFPQGEEVGTMVSFDPEAGRECSKFVLQSLHQLYTSSDQDIPRSPDWEWL